MTQRSDDLYLRDMLDMARLAVERVAGRDRASLDHDPDLRDATIRRIGVIGEAARHVSDATRTGYPDIPWHKITGTRHRLVHEYAEVDLDIVWEIVTARLPELVTVLERRLGVHGDDP